MTIRELTEQIVSALADKKLAKDAIPEHISILRAFQFASEYRTAALSTWGPSK